VDLWVMVCKSPPTELVDQKNIWDLRVYGLSKSWVMRGSTASHIMGTLEEKRLRGMSVVTCKGCAKYFSSI
jgi:hypothetical protein